MRQKSAIQNNATHHKTRQAQAATLAEKQGKQDKTIWHRTLLHTIGHNRTGHFKALSGLWLGK